jgi:glycosyltransferase involved in cell wall biosynthesis
MKVAIFHLGFFYSGGGEKLILEEMKGLQALGHTVTCYAPYVDRESCFPDVSGMAEVETLLPPPPRWLPMKDALWLTLSCLLIPFFARRFASYDIFFGANQPAPWFTFILSKILRKPYVIYLAQPLRILHPRKVDLENGIKIREGDYRFLVVLKKTAGFIINWADRISVRCAHAILVNGEHVGRWITNVYGVQNEVCPAGCYPEPKKTLRYSTRWKGDVEANGNIVPKPYVLLTNRHSPQKRFEYALWALKMIQKQVPRLNLIITGQETSYTDQLRYLVKGLGIAGKVHFIGLVTEQDLKHLYREAAFYVYPAPEEDFGMGIVEAMATGTPVIAWNNAGPGYIVKNDKTGFLIEPYDTEEFAEKMLWLANDPAMVESMGRAGHQRATEMYSYKRHCEILERTLLDVIEGHETRSQVYETPKEPSVGHQSAGPTQGQLVISSHKQSERCLPKNSKYTGSDSEKGLVHPVESTNARGGDT